MCGAVLYPFTIGPVGKPLMKLTLKASGHGTCGGGTGADASGRSSRIAWPPKAHASSTMNISELGKDIIAVIKFLPLEPLRMKTITSSHSCSRAHRGVAPIPVSPQSYGNFFHRPFAFSPSMAVFVARNTLRNANSCYLVSSPEGQACGRRGYFSI